MDARLFDALACRRTAGLTRRGLVAAGIEAAAPAAARNKRQNPKTPPASLAFAGVSLI